jgi:phytoene synthase
MNDRPSRGAEADMSMADRAADAAQVRAVVLRARSSFATGMKVLSAERRDAMFAVYAFCREVDDIADGDGSPQDKLQRLNAWRADVDAFCGGRPSGAVGRSLARAVADFGLRQEDFLAIIDGMEMDAAHQVRLADMDELHLYCDRVACAVGRLSVRVFGMEPGPGDALAKALGEALQLTNILRDLHEDAVIERLYLPATRLRAHGIDGDGDALFVLRQPRLGAVCDEIAQLARVRYQESARLAAGAPRRQVLPAMLMMHAYERLLAKLQRRGWRDVSMRVSLSRPEKLWIALRHGPWGW